MRCKFFDVVQESFASQDCVCFVPCCVPSPEGVVPDTLQALHSGLLNRQVKVSGGQPSYPLSGEQRVVTRHSQAAWGWILHLPLLSSVTFQEISPCLGFLIHQWRQQGPSHRVGEDPADARPTAKLLNQQPSLPTSPLSCSPCPGSHQWRGTWAGFQRGGHPSRVLRDEQE